jgi:hypothetical protein
MSRRQIIGIAVLVLILAGFAYDRMTGWRSLGLAAGLYGCWIIWRRRAAYGSTDHAESRYADDAMATLVGLLVIAIGMIFFAAPEIIDHVYLSARLRS